MIRRAFFSNKVQASLPLVCNMMLVSKRDITFSQVAEALETYGFTADRQRGSHVQFVKDTYLVTVPKHGERDLAPGTVAAIVRQAEAAGINRAGFKKDIIAGGR